MIRCNIVCEVFVSLVLEIASWIEMPPRCRFVFGMEQVLAGAARSEGTLHGGSRQGVTLGTSVFKIFG